MSKSKDDCDIAREEWNPTSDQLDELSEITRRDVLERYRSGKSDDWVQVA